ncbi:MAG: NADH-quinone oxidoreductase subunit J [Deltaproteobacteria bacterium]|jgi:NADH-quinone oxidoreductase subunit J|nr:NADH-quinone oxidoreductase subunit J [Deltaproteobacteria bacterium]
MSTVTGLLMAIAICGALLAVSLKNVLHAIFGLAITLLALAGLFMVLGSPFVAAMEVLIYVGGISVAMVFAVMLSTVVPKHAAETSLRKGAAALVALTFLLGVGAIVVGADLPSTSAPTLPAELWSVAHLGTALLDHYNLVFEVLSVVLLVAIIGAIVISRREEEHTES